MLGARTSGPSLYNKACDFSRGLFTTLPAQSNGYRTGWWRIRVEGKEFEVFKSLPEKMPLLEIEEVLAKALEKKVCVLRESVEPN